MARLNLQLGAARFGLEITRLPTESQIQQAKDLYEQTHITWEGDFSSWDEALSYATGYNSPVILERAIAASRAVENREAVCERDTVLFEKPQIAHPLLSALLLAASQNNQCLDVMDVGGSLGTSYRQNKQFLAHMHQVRWGIVEQENFVKEGEAEFQTDELQFFYSVNACQAALNPNFLLLSGVLQYSDKPYEFLADLLDMDIPFVFIDRTMAHRFACDRLVIQKVPPSIYPANYPVWMLDAARIESIFSGKGYEVLYEFDPHPGSTFGPPDFVSPYAGWLLRKFPNTSL